MALMYSAQEEGGGNVELLLKNVQFRKGGKGGGGLRKLLQYC